MEPRPRCPASRFLQLTTSKRWRIGRPVGLPHRLDGTHLYRASAGDRGNRHDAEPLAPLGNFAHAPHFSRISGRRATPAVFDSLRTSTCRISSAQASTCPVERLISSGGPGAHSVALSRKVSRRLLASSRTRTPSGTG